MQIISQINQHGFVKVNDLSESLQVSLVTIRKDLAFLESLELLFRTHGGASKQSIFTFERSVGEKETIKVDQKKQIAIAAKTFIKNNDAVILASGTTVIYLARLLKDYESLTVLSVSLQVALELSDASGVSVIHLGGVLRKNSLSVVGPLAEHNIAQFSCNTLFLGVDGIDINYGLTTSSQEVASLNKAMILASDKIIVLTDSSKIGKHSLCKIANIEDIHTIITDNGITKETKKHITNLGVNVIIAGL